MKIDKEGITEYVWSFVQALIFFLILYTVFWPMGIDGNSMEPGLHHNDRVIMSRLLAKISHIDRGDMVICKIEIDGKEKDIIKRVIAIPGDHIVISGGSVFLNNEELDEGYIFSKNTLGNLDIILNKGEYFILGDNREISHDSRTFGPLSSKKITGKVILKWYPFNDMEIY